MSGAEALLRKHYSFSARALETILTHSRKVADKALAIASRSPISMDLAFVEEAALLHDIGVFMTQAPAMDCHGPHPYICHGHLGRKLLESEGLPRHALVCERHVGVGLSAADIEHNAFPLPRYDMLPASAEEKLICLADKFFSKHSNAEKSLTEVQAEVSRYGRGKLDALRGLCDLFGL